MLGGEFQNAQIDVMPLVFGLHWSCGRLNRELVAW
jgi:hypothetical protein